VKFTGGLPETACGYGSTLRATEGLRAALPALLARLGTEVLLDAPCGDLNWMSRVDLSGVVYIGVDTSDENLRVARTRAPDVAVGKKDIVAGPLPQVDTVLCRDFLQHLPTAMAQQALENIAATGAKWLLATSHDVEINEDIAEPGGFRPLNLSIAPFEMGAPVEVIDDGPGRIVGVWAQR
jgi:hypothetical protein